MDASQFTLMTIEVKMMPFVWVQDVGVGAIIDAADFLEMRTNLDIVDAAACAVDNAGANVGEDVGHDNGDDFNENVGEDIGENVGEDTGENVGANTGEDVGENVGAQVDQTLNNLPECSSDKGPHVVNENTGEDVGVVL